MMITPCDDDDDDGDDKEKRKKKKKMKMIMVFGQTYWWPTGGNLELSLVKR